MSGTIFKNSNIEKVATFVTNFGILLNSAGSSYDSLD